MVGGKAPFVKICDKIYYSGVILRTQQSLKSQICKPNTKAYIKFTNELGLGV